MLRKKGRLVASRNVRKMTAEEKATKDLARAITRLGGRSNWDTLRQQ